MKLDLDPDRRLALAYVPARRRDSILALWHLDLGLASVLATGREPMISRIRLAWWRESLEKLDHQPAPAEPVLRAVAEHLLPSGLTGTDLGRMTEGWEALLSPDPLGAEDLDLYADLRGAGLFAASAHILGGDLAGRESGGRTWALVDLARHSGEVEGKAALAAACAQPDPGPWESSLRPLGMLAILARRDACLGLHPPEAQGSPSRMLRMLAHRLSGR